jgi:transcriptional regulator with XRE-family HTH domain
LVKNSYIDANLRRAKNPNMMVFQITGGMLRAARSLAGLTQQELADRASISRPCLTTWEGSSGGVPNAGVHALHRVVTALEMEGVEFRPNGVTINERPSTPVAGTVLHSEGAAA